MSLRASGGSGEGVLRVEERTGWELAIGGVEWAREGELRSQVSYGGTFNRVDGGGECYRRHRGRGRWWVSVDEG